MKPIADTGRIQPTVRRVASSTTQDGHRSANQVDQVRLGRAVDELPEVDERPAQADDRAGDEQPVDDGDAAAAPFDSRVNQKREHQREQQEADAINLRLDDGDDPPQRVDRQRHRQRRGDRASGAGQRARRGLGLERLDQIRAFIRCRIQ